MVDVNELVQQAMGVLGTFLPFAAAKAAEGFLSEPGAKLFGWLEDKVQGTPAEAALERAVAVPLDEDALDRLATEIRVLVRNNQELRGQLEAKLAEVGVVVTQSATASGGSTIYQVAGNKNRVGG